MKKLILSVSAAALVALAGCKSVSDTGTMYATSYAIGLSAGLVCNQVKIDDDSRNTIVEIVNLVSQYVPETNQTFEAAWTPIAKAHVDKLIADGKINAAQGDLIMAGFSVVVKGIDYIFEVRYPEAKQYKDLTIAAIDGFSAGFLTVFKPTNGFKIPPSAFNYDQDAYDYLNDWIASLCQCGCKCCK